MSLYHKTCPNQKQPQSHRNITQWRTPSGWGWPALSLYSLEYWCSELVRAVDRFNMQMDCQWGIRNCIFCSVMDWTINKRIHVGFVRKYSDQIEELLSENIPGMSVNWVQGKHLAVGVEGSFPTNYSYSLTFCQGILLTSAPFSSSNDMGQHCA